MHHYRASSWNSFLEPSTFSFGGSGGRSLTPYIEL